MRRWLAVFILCLVQFVDVLGVTSTTTAIPSILDGLNAPESAAGLIVTVYAMFFGGLLVLGSRLGDRHGHRRMLLIGVVVFSLVSVLGATSVDIVQLLAARSLQGAAAAFSVPSALRLLLNVSADERSRRSALALWSASGAAAGAAGFLVGGVLAQVWGWPALFWVNMPIGILLVVGILAVVPVLAPDNRGQRLDVVGAALLTICTMSVVAGGSLAESPNVRLAGAGLVLLGSLLGAGFFFQQRRGADPLIPRDAATSSNLRAGTVISFVNTATTSSITVLATLVLQKQLGATPVQAGLALISFSLAVIVGSSVSKPLADRLPARRLAGLGLLIIALGSAFLVLSYGTWWGIVAGAAISGVGLGISSVAGTGIGTSVPAHLEGSASGILNTSAQLGTAVGVASLVLVASTITFGPIQGTAVAWTFVVVLALATSIWISRTRSSNAAFPGTTSNSG
jgi:MFS family permease